MNNNINKNNNKKIVENNKLNMTVKKLTNHKINKI